MQEETESFFQDTFPRDTGLKRKMVLQCGGIWFCKQRNMFGETVHS